MRAAGITRGRTFTAQGLEKKQTTVEVAREASWQTKSDKSHLPCDISWLEWRLVILLAIVDISLFWLATPGGDALAHRLDQMDLTTSTIPRVLQGMVREWGIRCGDTGQLAWGRRAGGSTAGSAASG